MAIRRFTDDERRERKAEVDRAWRLGNTGLARELKREWYWRNLEHARASNRERNRRWLAARRVLGSTRP